MYLETKVYLSAVWLPSYTHIWGSAYFVVGYLVCQSFLDYHYYMYKGVGIGIVVVQKKAQV